MMYCNSFRLYSNTVVQCGRRRGQEYISSCLSLFKTCSFIMQLYKIYCTELALRQSDDLCRPLTQCQLG